MNPCLLHWQADSLPLSHQGSPWSLSLSVCVSVCGACSVMANSLQPRGCSPLGSSARGIFQARTLERVAISASRESSRPRDGTSVSYVPSIGGWILLPLRHLGISFHYSRPLFMGHPSFISLHLLSFIYQGYLLYNHLSHWLIKKSRRRIHASKKKKNPFFLPDCGSNLV